jgi:hypothetical protein
MMINLLRTSYRTLSKAQQVGKATNSNDEVSKTLFSDRNERAFTILSYGGKMRAGIIVNSAILSNSEIRQHLKRDL